MTELKIVSMDGQLVTDSRDVAEMIGKEHKNLLRDIKGYAEILDGSNLSSANFFITNTYTNSQNKEMPCYLLTRKGCDMVANKMTGEKGVLFTAAYVTKFEEMEKQQQPKQLTPSELALLQAQNLVAMERKLLEQDDRIGKIETEQQNINEIIGLSMVEWRKKVTGILNRIAQEQGGFEMFKGIRSESYKILEERAKCKLSIRVTNKQKAMALNGVAKSTINKVSKLDAIADDSRLTEIYLAIVKELAVKYRVNLEGIS